MRSLQLLAISISASAFTFGLMTAPAFAEGYDKGTLFSGRYSGVATAVTGSVQGAESVFFNPAGLAAGTGTEFSANFSPTFSQFQGVAVPGGSMVSSKTDFSPIFGIFASRRLTDAIGVGLGIYASGGTQAEYDGVDLTGANAAFAGFNPDLKASLSVIEISPSVAYSILPHLRIGAAWRIAIAKGEFSTLTVYPAGVLGPVPVAVAAGVNHLSQTRFNGFRLGGQWTTDDEHTGVGVTWRTAMKFVLSGTSYGQSQAAAPGQTPTNLTGSATRVSTEFPSQINIGAFHDVTDWNTRFLFGYEWTNYSVDRELAIDGTLGGKPIPNSTLNWRNQHLIKLGAQTADWQDWQYRGGVAYVTQVVPNDQAAATLNAPGGAFSLHAGVGRYLMDKALDVDASLEYDLVTGSGTNSANGAAGDFRTKVYAVHTGITYHL